MNWSDYFTYDPVGGFLVWRERKSEQFKNDGTCKAWNNRHSGKMAGRAYYKYETKAPHQWNIHVTDASIGVKISTGAHRVIWEMMVGPIPPKSVIDHINGNPFDNRLCNLRLATLHQNARNSKVSRKNTSGYKGVCFHKVTGKWSASIQDGGMSRHIGLFDLPEDAHAAYSIEAARIFGDYARKDTLHASVIVDVVRA